jgi:hypothetical protein
VYDQGRRKSRIESDPREHGYHGQSRTGEDEMILTTMTARCMLLALPLALTLGCVAEQGNTVASQTPEEVARKLAALAVELGGYDRTLDRGAELAWGSSAEALALELGRELSEEGQKRVRDILRAALGEFLTTETWSDGVTRVYAKHFTAAELDAMVEFYESPVGRKVLQLEDTLIEEFDGELEVVLDGKLDELVARIDEALAEAFEELDRGEGS